MCQNKSNYSPLIELEQLRQQYAELKAAFEKNIAGQKQVENELKNSEAKYKAIFKSTGTATLIVDEETYILMANDECFELFGYDPASLIEKKWTQFVAPESLEEMLANHQIRRKNPDLAPHKYEVKLLNNKGEKRDVVLNVNMIPETKQSVVSMLDITERKRAEEELHESEERFRMALEGTSIIVASFDTDLRYTFIHNPYPDFNASEVLGKRDSEIAENEGTRRLTALKQRTIDTGLPQNEEIVFPVSTGEITYFVKMLPIMDDGGKIIGAKSASYDITVRKQAEEELLKAKSNLEEYFENDISADYLASPLGEIFSCNKTFLSLFGFDKKSETEKYDITRLYKNPEDRKQIVRLINQKRRVENYEVEFITKEGKTISAIINAIGIFDKSGKLEKIRGYIVDINKQKEAENKLILSQERYRRFFEDSITGNYHSTLDGKILMCNDTFVKILKYGSKDELTGINTSELYFENSDRENFLNNLRAQKKLQNNELTLKARDGSKVEIIENVIGLFNDTGELKEFIGYMWDVTARKQAEKEKLKLSYAVEQSPASVIISDLDGNIEYANPKTLKITGYTKKELIGKNPRMFKSGETPENEYKNLWETISSGKEWNGEFQNKKKNGELYWESASISPIFNEKKEIINYVAVKEDITERKKFEANQNLLLDISKTANNYNLLFPFLENVHNRIKQILRADNFYVGLYNENDQTFTFPYHLDEYDHLELNKPYDFSKGFTDYVYKSNQSLIITPEYQLEIEKDEMIKGYGDDLSVWLGVPLKPTEKSKPIGVIAIQDYKNLSSYSENDKSILEIIAYHIFSFIERIRNIENLVRAKEKAEESDRLKSAFLANMSHEIRTPMNGILGFTELLLEPDLSSKQKEAYINIVNQSGQRMLNTVNDIVEISKIEAGLVTVDLKEVDVQVRLNEIIRFFTPEATKKGLKLIVENKVPKTVGVLSTDQNKIDSIFTNLIKNAIKYTPTGEIRVGSKVHENRLEFYIKDTGIGIPAKRQQAVFERFMQADIEDKDARQGSGLGLSIAKAHVEMLGGKIWVESREGIGSTFYFTLPLERNIADNSSAEKKNSFKNEKSKSLNKRLKILIAEDDETSRQYLRLLVNDYGNEILGAETGGKALELCQKYIDIDLILMDIQMPGLNGYEATRKIREFNKEVVIIAQTAFALSGDREKAIEAGCNDYISKPVKKAELQKLVERYFG